MDTLQTLLICEKNKTGNQILPKKILEIIKKYYILSVYISRESIQKSIDKSVDFLIKDERLGHILKIKISEDLYNYIVSKIIHIIIELYDCNCLKDMEDVLMKYFYYKGSYLNPDKDNMTCYFSRSIIQSLNEYVELINDINNGVDIPLDKVYGMIIYTNDHKYDIHNEIFSDIICEIVDIISSDISHIYNIMDDVDFYPIEISEFKTNNGTLELSLNLFRQSIAYFSDDRRSFFKSTDFN